MKLITWNVNGFRACLKKGFREFFEEVRADAFCLQETKMLEGEADFSPEGYHAFYHSAVKRGYAGTAVFVRQEPLALETGLHGQHLDEGRVMTLEYPDHYLVNCYVPNAQPGLARLDYRMAFEDDMRAYLGDLATKKPVVYCGDLNVAHKEIDLKNPEQNVGNPGFSDEEREKMTELLSAGFTDVFRYLYPDRRDAYTWWSYRTRARLRNIGWRIDYFVISDHLCDRVQDLVIHDQVEGSDHCPVELQIDLKAQLSL